MEIRATATGDQERRQEAADNNSNSLRSKKYRRHSPYQIQRLEEFFKEFPHPDESQRRELSKELGLEPKQIKFWFQNKRTQTKAQNDRADNSFLRSENERIEIENHAIREALKTVNCPACGGPDFGPEERKRCMRELQVENVQLKEEHRRVAAILARCIGKPVSEIEKLASLRKGSLQFEGSLNPCVEMDIDNGLFPSSQMEGIIGVEKALMVDTAANALDELTKLLQVDDPLWVKSPLDGRCVILHRQTYETIFPGRADNIRDCTSSARFESSKHSGVVPMSATQLVDIFLESDKWVDFFPTIVTKDKTIQALENGTASGDSHGALQLKYEKMHILSPLVPSREFCFLRHCQRIEEGSWVIADVSYDFSKEGIFPSRCWRFPSGCMIQDLNNGFSKVTWVEHVHVDDKTQTHRLYRDLVCSSYSIAYGAERWVLTLERMCERFTYFSKLPETPSDNEFGRVVTTAEGKQSIMNLSNRMVKSFCETLNMSGKLEFPQLAEMTNGGVRISVREATEAGEPIGMIVSAATSLLLPLPPQALFEFFKDRNTRFQWDILSNGYPVNEVEHISTGAHPGNCISIIRPFVPTENSMFMLQESCIDSLGSLVIYAPIDMTTLNTAITGGDSSEIPILPSGFIISADGRSGKLRRSRDGASTSSHSSPLPGSILTVAYQILVSYRQLNMESVAAVNALVSSTVQKIRTVLDCCNDLD